MTYVHTVFSIRRLRPPTKLGLLAHTFTKSKHPEHVTHPPRNIVNQANVQILALCVDVDICSRNELAQMTKCFRGIEGIA